MSQSELEKLYRTFDGKILTPNYSYAECLVIKNEDGEVIDCEYTDFILHKTAEEVYQEYLNPPPPQPTVEDFNLEIDYRITMLEMIGGV